MMVLLTSALLIAAAALAAATLMRDSKTLLDLHGEWDAQLTRIDRGALHDPAGFSLRPATDPRRMQARPASAPQRSAAA